MNIRVAKQEDVAAVQYVAKESWKTTYEGIIPGEIQERFISEAYSERSMLHRLTRTLLLVAEVECEIVGFANFTGVNVKGESELIAIYQLQRYQRQGIGTALLKHGLSSLSDVRTIHLNVSEQNVQGRMFYKKHGFIEEKSFDDELFGFKETLIRMVKHI